MFEPGDMVEHDAHGRGLVCKPPFTEYDYPAHGFIYVRFPHLGVWCKPHVLRLASTQ